MKITCLLFQGRARPIGDSPEWPDRFVLQDYRLVVENRTQLMTFQHLRRIEFVKA